MPDNDKLLPVAPVVPPAPEPQEYFPGYKLEAAQLGRTRYQAQKRLTEASRGLEKVQKLGVRHPLSGVFGFGPGEGYFATIGQGIISEEDYKRTLAESQAAMELAIQEDTKISWKQQVLTSLPIVLMDMHSGIRSIDELVEAFPNEFIDDTDRQWLEGLWERAKGLMAPELPPEFMGSPEEARTQLLDTILKQPKMEMRGVHHLTVDELLKSFQPRPPELPKGMDTEDVKSIIKSLQFDEETQKQIEDLHQLSEDLVNDWKCQIAYQDLLRSGTIEAEAPELTLVEFLNMTFTQPALASLELLEKYFNILPRPLSALAIMAFPRIRKDSDAAELERLYEQYKDMGENSWEAASLAFQNWDTNIWLKMFVETMFDPTTYIGLGVATRITKPLPYVGKFVGALERGWLEMWDLPFRGARQLINKIPKTPGQHALSTARQVFMDSRAYMRRVTGKNIDSLSRAEVVDSLELAAKQAAEMPHEIDNMAVRVGRSLIDHDFITDTQIKDMLTTAGVKKPTITKQLSMDFNYEWDRFFYKTQTAKEMAADVLAHVGVEPTDKILSKLATQLTKQRAKIIDGVGDIFRGDTAKEVLDSVFKNVEDLQLRKVSSPIYDFVNKSGKATSWITRSTDKIIRNSWVTALDRHVTAPMANQYLLFTNYGPFNVAEGVMRSFLGAGELFYPVRSSPIDEVIRIGEGLTNLPYDFIQHQGRLGRLEIAVTDPKSGKTMVFSKGKIPFITKKGPVGTSIKIGNKDYPIRSTQDWNDMFGDIGTQQRAWYYLTKYKQLLWDEAPDEMARIAKVFDDSEGLLAGIESFSKKERADVRRVLEQDATVGPDMVRKHDVPVLEMERKRAAYEINKVMDKCTDIYSIHKKTIREEVLSGKMFKEGVDNRIAAVGDSIREFNIASLTYEADVLDTLVKDMAEFVPENSDELLRTMGFISDLTEATGERISDVRQITRARAQKLAGNESDGFFKASDEVLGEFIGKSNESVDEILTHIRRSAARGVAEVPTDTVLRPLTPEAPNILKIDYKGTKSIGLLDVREKGGALRVRELRVDTPGIVNREFLRSTANAMDNFARLRGLSRVSISHKPEHRTMYLSAGFREVEGVEGRLPQMVRDVPKATGPILKPDQLTTLDNLSQAIRTRHANTLSTRELDRRIINQAMDATPKNKRDKAFWDYLEHKRSTEAWEPYWSRESELFEAVEDMKNHLMVELGVTPDATNVVPEVVDKLTPAHVAYMLGVTGDDLNKGLTKVGAMVTIRPKRQFVTWVYSRAKKTASKVGKVPDDIGFSKEAIGDVYDQMFANLGLDPKVIANEPLTPTMHQLEEVRQELHRIEGVSRIPDNDYVKYKGYINKLADDLEASGVYTDKFWAEKESAMMKTRTQYEMDFTDYSNANMVDAAMRMIFPFWTYEVQRWFWLPRTFLKTPGVGTGVGRYVDYSEQGYIPIPGTDIQFNPLRGTVFMGGFRRLYLRDFPEYYDNFPGMEIIDYISRIGFYPGIHTMLPIVAYGAAIGKPEWGELAPAWVKTPLNAARAVAPEQAGKIIDQVFPDRFRDYLTMLTLASQGYDADEIWRKRKKNVKLTEEEEKLWLRAEAKATGLKGILFEQTGLFRLRPQEYTQILKDYKELIAELTGVPVSVQETIQRRFPVTGKRFSDYYKLDSLQQKIVYEAEAYKRWQGVTTPLYPSTWQQEDVDVRDYFEKVEQLSDESRHSGIFDEQGTLIQPSITELTRQWVSGEIGPDQWISGRGSVLDHTAAAALEMGKRDYPDVPKTLDEREQRYIDRGIPAPTYGPDQELLYKYYEIKPVYGWDWDNDRYAYDFDVYYAKIDALMESLQGEYKQRFEDRIQYDWSPMEKLYWQVSREHLRPYRLIRNLVLEQYSPEQQVLIRRYEVARGTERDEIKDAPGPEGRKLISHFTSTLRESKQRYRMLDPTTDAWSYFFGRTDTLITTQAKETYAQLGKRYLVPEMIG